MITGHVFTDGQLTVVESAIPIPNTKKTMISMMIIIPTTIPMTEKTIDAIPRERAELGDVEAWPLATTTHQQGIRYETARHNYKILCAEAITNRPRGIGLWRYTSMSIIIFFKPR